MTMVWNGDTIVDLSREFLASNGARSTRWCTSGKAQRDYLHPVEDRLAAERMHTMLTDLNVASNKGLSERFDSTIGAGAVLMPFGGREAADPEHGHGRQAAGVRRASTAAAMAWGFNPYIMEKNQFTGAYLSVVGSSVQAGGRRLRA